MPQFVLLTLGWIGVMIIMIHDGLIAIQKFKEQNPNVKALRLVLIVLVVGMLMLNMKEKNFIISFLCRHTTCVASGSFAIVSVAVVQAWGFTRHSPDNSSSWARW